MIEHPYPENITGLFEPSGDLLIFAARCGSPGRVVVDEDNSCSRLLDCSAVDFLGGRYFLI
jgi:hypothetical protein